MKTLSIDVEAFNDQNLAKCSVYHYVEPPVFEILLFSCSTDEHPIQIVDLACGENIPNEVPAVLVEKFIVKTLTRLSAGLNTKKRYDEAKAKLDAFAKKIADKKARRATIEGFLKVLQEHDGFVTEFQINLWHGLMDFLTVYAVDDVWVTFKNGITRFTQYITTFKQYCV